MTPREEWVLARNLIDTADEANEILGLVDDPWDGNDAEIAALRDAFTAAKAYIAELEPHGAAVTDVPISDDLEEEVRFRVERRRLERE